MAKVKDMNLVNAMLSGEIYLIVGQEQEGVMTGDNRRVITDECLRAATTWFEGNGKTMIKYGAYDKTKSPHLFYTNDADKAKKIMEILEANK